MASFISYEKEQIVSIYDIGHNGFLKPDAIFNYFQDIATLHSMELGLSYFDLIKLNEFWVLTRVTAEIIQLPKYNDTLKLVTYPIKPRLIDCDRDYYIYNIAGELIIKGVSKWVILDAETRRIKPVGANRFPSEERLIIERAIENPIWKVPVINNSIEISSDKKVNLGDIDFNMHMNNSRYISHAYDALNLADIGEQQLKRITVNYLKEIPYGQEYSIRKEIVDSNKTIISFNSGEDASFRAMFEFGER